MAAFLGLLWVGDGDNPYEGVVNTYYMDMHAPNNFSGSNMAVTGSRPTMIATYSSAGQNNESLIYALSLIALTIFIMEFTKSNKTLIIRDRGQPWSCCKVAMLFLMQAIYCSTATQVIFDNKYIMPPA